LATIYHIANAADWEQATTDGTYTTSTKGRTLEEQGFIHATQSAPQTNKVANSFYKDAGEPLIVLVISTDKLTSPFRYDDVPGWNEAFPHIYGPLNPDAVVDVVPLVPGPDGEFTFTPPATPG
jgi:glutathione S-transferase